MKALPLRNMLTFQHVVSLFLSVLIILLLGLFWVLPQIRSEVESRQSELAKAVSLQLETYLETCMAIVGGVAAIDISAQTTILYFEHLLDAQLRASTTLNSIVVADAKGHTLAAGVSTEKEPHRQDLLNLDISRTPLFQQVTEKNEPHWSETFLSVITGKLSVAYAVPQGKVVAIGEVELVNLSKFLNHIVEGKDLFIMIIDSKGQIIVDGDNTYTGQQFNVSNIPVVQKAIRESRGFTDRFDFQGRQMVGSVLQVPLIDWIVLVAQPVSSMYRPILLTALIVIGGLITALLSGVGLAMIMSGKFSTALDSLNALAGDVANGKQPAVLPETSIAEFNMLAANFQKMAAVLLVRERERMDSETKLRLILDSTGEAIYGIDLQGQCTFYNSACLKILGYHQEQNLHGKNMHELIHHTRKDGTPFPIEDCPVCEVIRQRQESYVVHDVLWRMDGTSFPAEIRSYPQFEKGRLTGAVITFIDISVRNRLEEQLRQSQKMESIGRLAGGVAHDFNNMLSIILGYAEMSMLESPEHHNFRHNLSQITKAAERSRDITRQLLAFSRKEIIAPQPVNLNDRIVDSKKHFGRLIGEDIKFKFRPSKPLWMVKIDPSQLDQILINLLVNARDAMPDGGSLRVETANVHIDALHGNYNTDAKTGDYVQLTVSDDGHGMDRETQEHIFEPFYTTKGIGEGTGLGLATVYGIVTQNAGFINVYSEPSQGTVFKIFLPRLVEERIGEEPDISGEELTTGTGIILLVEDEEMLLEMTTRLLTKVGYEVIQASTPFEAMAICEKNDQQIDMILTDVVMPGMNGREMVEKILTIRPGMKVLFMSGYTADIVAQRGVIEKGVNFIQKPLEIKQLNEKIKQVLG